MVHRQHDDFAVEALGFQTSEHVEAREPWHREVGDDDVGAKPRGGVDQTLAVANRADHLEVGLSQYSRQAVGDNRVIVSQEDGGSAGHATCPSIPEPTSNFTRAFIGIVACTRVP